MAAATILNSWKCDNSDPLERSISDLEHFHQILIKIAPVIKNWQHLLGIQDGGGSHLEKYASDGTTDKKMEFLFVTFNPEANFCGVTLAFKGSFLSWTPML